LLSLSSKPHSPSPVCVFPGSFLFGSFSSLSVWVYWWFLSVPVLLSSFTSPFLFFLSILLGAGVGSLFIGPRERGLIIAVHGERGSAGLAGQWAWLARCGAPDFSLSRLGVARLLQGTWLTGINEERGRKLSTFPCCTSGGRRKKNSVAQNDTVLPFFFYMKRRRFIQNQSDILRLSSFWSKSLFFLFFWFLGVYCSKSFPSSKFSFNCFPLHLKWWKNCQILLRIRSFQW